MLLFLLLCEINMQILRVSYIVIMFLKNRSYLIVSCRVASKIVESITIYIFYTNLLPIRRMKYTQNKTTQSSVNNEHALRTEFLP